MNIITEIKHHYNNCIVLSYWTIIIIAVHHLNTYTNETNPSTYLNFPLSLYPKSIYQHYYYCDYYYQYYFVPLQIYIMMMYCVCYQCVYHNVNNHHQQLRIVHGKKGIYCYHSIYISFYRQPTSLPNSFIRKKNLSYTHLHTNIIKHHSYVSSIYVHLYLSNEISHNRRSFYSFIIHFHVPSYTIYMIAYNNNKIKGINIIYIHKKH